MTPRLAVLEGRDANLKRADQLAALRHGPQGKRASLPRASRQASELKSGAFRDLYERERSPGNTER